MNKEDILKMSREENNGKYDERELDIMKSASKVGMSVGAFLSVVLVLIGYFVLHSVAVAMAGWTVFLAMVGSSNIVTYIYLRKKSKLIYGVGNIVFSVLAFLIAIGVF